MAMTQTAWHVLDDAHYREPHRMPGRAASHGGHPHNLTAAGTIVEGSVVRLKSGGPKMTVDEVREDGIAHTIRFIAEELGWRVSREALSVKTLELAAD